MSNPVKILGFVTKTDNMVKYPVPDGYIEDYLSENFRLVDVDGNKQEKSSPDIPLELREELLLNAWADKDGNIWWSENYYPEPFKDEDGNVYLMMGDKQMGTDRGRGLMMRAMMMLPIDDKGETQ